MEIIDPVNGENGASVLRCFGASVLRRFGASVLRCFGASVLRRFGASALYPASFFGGLCGVPPLRSGYL